jgi:hypothetical protein
MGLVFGFQNMATLFYMFRTYQNPSRDNIVRLTMLFHLYFFGIFGTLFQLTLIGTYATIYYWENVVELYDGVKEGVIQIEKELAKDSSTKLSPNEMMHFEMCKKLVTFVETVKKTFKGLEKKINKNKSTNFLYQFFQKGSKRFNDFNGPFYMEQAQNLTLTGIQFAATQLEKVPYVKYIRESFDKVYHDMQDASLGSTGSGLLSSEQQELKNQLEALEGMMNMMDNIDAGKLFDPNSNQNQNQSLNLGELKPPTEEEMVSMNELMKVMGQLGMNFDQTQQKSKNN